MYKKLEEIEGRYQELTVLLSNRKVLSDQVKFQQYAQEYSEISEIVDTYNEFKRIDNELNENKKLLNEGDEEIKELAREEISALKEKISKIEEKIKNLLCPKDPNDNKNTFLEIRAGTGGEEASLFVASLFRMYSKYAEKFGWKVEIISQNPTGLGGFKEIIALIAGNGVYSRLKYESGVHRVQRVPETESQGRIHTSAVTVAVLPEADEIEINIDPQEMKIDVYRSSGPGGQSVNTTDSAVRITHIPTNIVVCCQDEKSQHKNKAKAMKVMRARLFDMAIREQQKEISNQRKSQVGSGDRSERIRTYNFPQGRVTDHRIGLTLYRLEMIMEGELDEIIDPLITYFRTENLKASLLPSL
ncbi:MAG: peptide chain release factor 1 [Thermodesulfobacteriota bacterium]|nr:peptide chain release factor 1 [Thermodesulfobacteriota bacterium]